MAYFDVGFSAGHTPIGFSTSPITPTTHWKQTVRVRVRVRVSTVGIMLFLRAHMCGVSQPTGFLPAARASNEP